MKFLAQQRAPWERNCRKSDYKSWQGACQSAIRGANIFGTRRVPPRVPPGNVREKSSEGSGRRCAAKMSRRRDPVADWHRLDGYSRRMTQVPLGSATGTASCQTHFAEGVCKHARELSFQSEPMAALAVSSNDTCVRTHTLFSLLGPGSASKKFKNGGDSRAVTPFVGCSSASTAPVEVHRPYDPR